MGDPKFCAAACGRWALACWRALSSSRRRIVLQLAGGKSRCGASVLWAEEAGLIAGALLPELTPLGRLVASVGVADIAAGGEL